MKNTLNKEEHDKLSDEFKAEYTEKDGVYTLTVEGGEDTGALKRAKDHEKNLRQKAEDKLRDTETNLEERETELEEIRKGAIPKADVEALENSYKEKQTKLEDQYKGQLDTANDALKVQLIDNVAIAMDAELGGGKGVLIPHIIKRLGTDTVDDKTVTRVLDADGKISATTLEELKAEFTSNENFASVITAGAGSGGGADGNRGKGGGAPKKDFDWANASPEDKAAQITAMRKAEGKEVGTQSG